MEVQSRTNAESAIANSINAIPRVDIASLTPELFFERYQKTGTPVLIRGLLDNEPDWNLDYLCEKLGDRELLFRHYGREWSKQDKRQWKSVGSGIERREISFNKYAEMVRTRQAHEEHIYLGKCSLENTLGDTPTLKTLGEPLGLTKPLTGFKMYMGPTGHVTSLHYDVADGTLVQLHGAKKVILFPPSETANLYPFPLAIHLRHGLKMRSWYSQVDLQNPDFESFPKFKEALCYKREVMITRGEILYIPTGWWHEVTTLGEGMACSATRFWRVYPTSRAVFSGGDGVQRWETSLPYRTSFGILRSPWATATNNNSARLSISYSGKRQLAFAASTR